MTVMIVPDSLDASRLSQMLSAPLPGVYRAAGGAGGMEQPVAGLGRVALRARGAVAEGQREPLE